MHNINITDRLSDAVDSTGRTLLHHTTKLDQKDLTHFLISRGCDVNDQDKDGMTPLMLAVLNRDEDTIRSLINREANVYTVNRFGQNVLEIAFAGEVLERRTILRLLCAVKNSCSTTDEIASHLVEAKCPIYTAVILGNTAVVHKMIELGVDVDARDSQSGSTALFQAVSAGNSRMVKLLLDHNANVNAEDDNGFTAVASLEACKLDVLKSLIEGGAHLTSTTSVGCFQVWTVLQRGSREAVGMVLRSNVEFAARDRLGLSLLDYIIQNANEDVIEEVKPHIHKFDVNTFDERGKCPLLRAVECENLRAVRLLLDNGAEVNCVEEVTGATPLYKCFMPKNPRDERRLDKCVELLLEHGAWPQVVTNYEFASTIFEMAWFNKRRHGVELVIARLAMIVRHGWPMNETVKLKLGMCDFYKRYYGLCWLALQENHGPADLFELLTVEISVMEKFMDETECLRNLIVLCEDETMKKCHGLYCTALKARVRQVLGKVQYKSCDCALPWTVGSKLDVPKMLEMNKKVLARHLRCDQCLRNFLRVCSNTARSPREMSLKKRMVRIVRKTDLQDRAGEIVVMISGGRLNGCNLILNEILGYLDDDSMEVLSCV